MHGKDIRIDEPFRVLLNDGTILDAGNLKPKGEPSATQISPSPHAPRLAATLHGEVVLLAMESGDHSIRVDWSIVLLEGSNYIRQIVTVAAQATKTYPSARVQLIDLNLPGAHVVGSVDGSPIVAGNWFVGFEHPLSQSKVRETAPPHGSIASLPLRAGQSVTYSSVIGVARKARCAATSLPTSNANARIPTAPFCITTPGTISATLLRTRNPMRVDRINAFGANCTEKRGVSSIRSSLTMAGTSTTRSGNSTPDFPMDSRR